MYLHFSSAERYALKSSPIFPEINYNGIYFSVLQIVLSRLFSKVFSKMFRSTRSWRLHKKPLRRQTQAEVISCPFFPLNTTKICETKNIYKIVELKMIKKLQTSTNTRWQNVLSSLTY